MSAPLAPLLSSWRSAPLPDLDSIWAVSPGGRAFAIAGLFDSLERTLFVIVPGEGDAEELVDDIELFTPSVVLAPAWETLPFEHVSPNLSTMALRARARHRLAQDEPVIVVASVRSAVQRLSTSPVAPLVLEKGDTVALDDLALTLSGIGYHRTDRVEARGEFAVRGGIVDVFPAQDDHPVRLDFWGDELDDIRQFSVASQRSEAEFPRLIAYPAREVRPTPDLEERARRLVTSAPWAASTWDRIAERQIFAGIESWLPWLADEHSLIDVVPDSATPILVDPGRALDRSRDLVKEEAELAAALAPTWGESAPEAGEHPALFLDLESELGVSSYLRMPSSPTGPSDLTMRSVGFDAIAGDPVSVAKGVNRLIEKDLAAVVAMDGEMAADRVARTLAEEGLALSRLDSLPNARSAVVPVGIHKGFIAPELGVAVLGEREIAGRRRAHRKAGGRDRRLHSNTGTSPRGTTSSITSTGSAGSRGSSRGR